MSERHFSAPWGKSLKAFTFFTVLICVGVFLIGLQSYNNLLEAIGAVIPIIILLTTMPFIIRGYRLNGSKLFVDRLFHSNEFDLKSISDVKIPENVNEKNYRTFGNGGAFSFSGNFRNKELGGFRAFVNDWEKSVAIKYEDNWIVVSPNDPNNFKTEIELHISSR